MMCHFSLWQGVYCETSRENMTGGSGITFPATKPRRLSIINQSNFRHWIPQELPDSAFLRNQKLFEKTEGVVASNVTFSHVDNKIQDLLENTVACLTLIDFNDGFDLWTLTTCSTPLYAESAAETVWRRFPVGSSRGFSASVNCERRRIWPPANCISINRRGANARHFNTTAVTTQSWWARRKQTISMQLDRACNGRDGYYTCRRTSSSVRFT